MNLNITNILKIKHETFKKIMWNILVCTSSFNKKNIDYANIPKYIEIKFNPYFRKLKEKELLKLITDKTIGIVSGTELITKKVILKAKNLQVISRCGTGTDNIDNFALKKKIKIFKTNKEPVNAVAEFVLAQILSTLKNLFYHNYFLKKKKWIKLKGKMLSHCTIGLIGYGKIGKKLNQLLKPFKSKIIVYDPFFKKFKNKKILQKLLTNSDIITLNIPYNKKNQNFINKSKLKLMKNDSLFVNCSRGGLVDEKELYKKLKKNKKFKVVLDCFTQEPYLGKLIRLDNVMLSPHVASYTQETRDSMEKKSFINCIENLKL